jgi:hypothetical protein
LKRLRPAVDLIVYVDGAYPDFPSYDPKTSASVDGSLETAREFADVILHGKRRANGTYEPWDEMAKRNAYLTGDVGDYYLVVDADEIIEGKTPGSKPEIDKALLATRPDWKINIFTEQKIDWPLHRLFTHRPGIHYRGAHECVHVGPEFIHPERLPKDTFPGIRLVHKRTDRPGERNERKGVYYDKLVSKERVWRAENLMGG